MSFFLATGLLYQSNLNALLGGHKEVNMGKIFIQRVLSRSAFEIFSPGRSDGKRKEKMKVLLSSATEIWEDKYHQPTLSMEI